MQRRRAARPRLKAKSRRDQRIERLRKRFSQATAANDALIAEWEMAARYGDLDKKTANHLFHETQFTIHTQAARTAQQAAVVILRKAEAGS